MDLKAALLQERLTLYVRLRGGYTFPLAGAIWWGGMAVLGYFVPIKSWALLAFIASGLIFPLAVVLSRLLHVNFMTEKSAVDDAIAPAFIGMLLFWPMAFAAVLDRDRAGPADSRDRHGHALAGSSAGRTDAWASIRRTRSCGRSRHSRSGCCFRTNGTTWVPASVSIVYLLTVIAILAAPASGRDARTAVGIGEAPLAAVACLG